MNIDDRKRREWEEATGVVVFMTVISIPIFFVLMSAKEAMQASALIMGVSFLIMGSGWAFFAPRKKSAPTKQGPVILTEDEFEFLASGVQECGFLGAQSTDGKLMRISESLLSKGLIKPCGTLPMRGSSYQAWTMTSKGVDVALRADFTPAPGWYPFGNPDQRGKHFMGKA